MPPTQQPVPTAAEAEAAKKKMLNVVRFGLAGHIVVNNKDSKTITKALDAIAKVEADLKASGAKFTADTEPQFVRVSADGADED